MMTLIQQLNSNISTDTSLLEDDGGAGGAVGAGSVSAVSMPLFASLVKRTITTHPRIIKYSNDSRNTNKKKKKGLGIREAFYAVSEDIAAPSANQTFDTSEAISKLKSLEDKESVDYRDTATFGLVDSNGDIVKVTIPSDQAQGFEQDIQYFLGDADESKESPEIAEVLFKMKDRYTIINVEWPTVEEDQEEGQEIEGTTPEGGEGMDQLPGTEGEPALPPDDMGAAGGADTGQVQDLLTQVIDMMKADADARKAEAQAREAEAKTKQAGAARDQAMARVKQEEQFLDMEEYNKTQKQKEKEAKRLAQLAQWKHNMNNGEEELPAQEPQYDFLPGEEEEEKIFAPSQLKNSNGKGGRLYGKVNSTDIAKYILQRTK